MELFAQKWPKLFFFPEEASAKRRKRSVVVAKSKTFKQYKVDFNILPLDVFNASLGEAEVLVEHDYHFERAILVVYVLNKYYISQLVLTDAMFDFGYELEPSSLTIPLVANILLNTDLSNEDVVWLSSKQHYSKSVIFAKSESVRGVFTSNSVSTIVEHRTLSGRADVAAARKLLSSTRLSKFRRNELAYEAAELRGKSIRQTIIPLSEVPYSHGRDGKQKHLVFGVPEQKYVALENSITDAKSQTMRTRQFYRSGVLWCWGLTLFTLVGPYYVFYGFLYVVSFWWFFGLVYLMRGVALLAWKFLPDVTKDRIIQAIRAL